MSYETSRLCCDDRPPLIKRWSLALGASLLVLAFASAAEAKDDQPKIGVSPSQLRFGSVETSKTKSTKIRNQGKADLEVTAIDPCGGTSSEFSWSAATPFTLAPKQSVKLEVTYTPADPGQDEGCLTIVSNDPKRGSVEVSLEGRADDGEVTVEGPDIDLTPDALGFGDVAIGASSTKSFKVKNKGTETLDGVTVGRCFETSPEYSWNPTDIFSVPPDESVKVDVTYTPEDVGEDQGCLAIVSNDPDENPAILDVSGTGVEGAAGVDLDITKFKVKKAFDPEAPEDVFVHLWVRNESDIDESAIAMVVGMQGGLVVYEETLEVADKSGNRGSKKYAFPSFAPAEQGEILWMATVDDADPDVDEAFAVTSVDGAQTTSVDVDIDAVRIKVTKKLSLARARPVRLRVWFENPGLVDEPRSATLTGSQGGVEVYSETLEISDRPGDDAATRYIFPPFVPEAPGDIIWTVDIADDDPDVDLRSAVTRVNP